MTFNYLADHKNFIPIIAKWYFDEWGHLMKDQNLEQATENLKIYLNSDKIPLMILAIKNDEPVGVAQLKYREMKIYPEKEHWLGGVFVPKKHRGKGIASQVVQQIIDKAIELNVQVLHLQTENLNGGLYRKMGWLSIEQVYYDKVDVLVMKKILNK